MRSDSGCLDIADGDGGIFGSLFGDSGRGDWTTDPVASLDAAALEDGLAALFEAEGADVERAGLPAPTPSTEPPANLLVGRP